MGVRRLKAGGLSYLASLFGLSRSLVFSSLVILVAVVQFWNVPVISRSVGILAFLAWVLSIKDSDRTSRTISAILALIGTVLFISIQAPLSQAIAAFAENTNILMVMVLVPLLGTVVDLGGYSESLSIISQDLRNPVFVYFVASLLTYFTGSVLLNAAIALVWAIMAPIVVKIRKDPGVFLASSIPRGYNASLLWTPASPTMAVALSLTGVDWSRIFSPGLLLSLIMLALATLVEMKNPAIVKSNASYDALSSAQFPKATSAEKEEKDPGKARAWIKTGALALGLASFIGGIIFLEKLGFTAIQAMAPCIVIVLSVWSLLLRKFREAIKASALYFSRRIPSLSNQFLLMTTAGFIGTAVKLFVNSRVSLFGSYPPVLSGSTGRLAFTLLTSFLIWLISIIGIHPIIGMTIIYSIVSPVASSYSGPYVTLTLILGSTLGFNISPVSATMLVTSSCCGKNTIDTGVKLQWKFVLTMWVVGSLTLSLLHI